MPNLSLNGTASFLPDPPLCITLGSNFFQKTSFLLDSRPAPLTCSFNKTWQYKANTLHKKIALHSLQDLPGTQARH